MPPRRIRILSLIQTVAALVTASLLSDTAMALDWRIIQDQIGTQAARVKDRPPPSTPLDPSFQIEAAEGRQGKVLFEEDFAEGSIGEYAGHPGVHLVKDPNGNGRCVQFSSSEFRLKNRIPIQPGHWIVIHWKSRTLSNTGAGSGDRGSSEGAFLEISYQDAEGKVVQPTPVPLPLGSAIRKASSAEVNANWEDRTWSLELAWGSTSRHTTTLPPDARSIGLRFFHNSEDQTVTLIDDLSVVDIQPAALQMIADTIVEHRQLLTTAVKNIRALPETPETRGWKQVVVDHSDTTAVQLDILAKQDPTSGAFIHGSDAPLLFARRLAEAAVALKSGLAHPETILTFWTRPIPTIGPFDYHARRGYDPVGVLPYASQIEGELANEVTIQACRGEFEPISIALWSPKNLNQVSLHASDLKGPVGQISASSLDIKLVKWWYQRNLRRNWHGFLVPKFLLNDDALVRVDLQEQRNYLKLSFPEGNRYVDPPSYDTKDATGIEEKIDAFPLRDSDSLQPFDLIGGQNKQVWITLKVPDNAPAGEYSGDLIFKVGDRELARFKVILRVLPFSLPAPKTRYDSSQDYTFSFYYRGRLAADGEGKIGFETKSEQQLRAELKIMYDHGIVSPLLLPCSWGRPFFRRELQIMHETGMSGRPLQLGRNVGNATAEKDLERLRQHVRERVMLAREYGFTDVYFYGQDEAGGELLFSQIPAWKAVREAGGKVHVAVMYDWVDKAPEELDTVIAFGGPRTTWATARHRIGGKITSYAYPHTTNPDALSYRRNCGLVGWINNYDGATPYCFMHNGKGVWNDLDETDYNIAFPTANGVIGTLALEALREGADDVRYATLLMKRIREAQSDGTAAAKAAAEEAFQWIEKEDFYTADLDRVRSKMVDYISSLSRE